MRMWRTFQISKYDFADLEGILKSEFSRQIMHCASVGIQTPAHVRIADPTPDLHQGGGGDGGGGGGEAYNLMSRGYRSKLSSRGCRNVV